MGFSEGMFTISLKTVHSLQWLKSSFRCLFTWLWASILYTVKHKGTKLECIQGDTKHLQKVPLHLAVIVQEDEISYDDLASLVVWAFAAGVYHVSLYDPNGNIRHQLVMVRNAIVSQYQQMFSPPVPDVEVCTSQELSARDPQRKGSAYTVLVLSPEDSQRDIVCTAVDICKSVLQRQLTVKDIDTSVVDHRISATQGFPDPDLAIVCGSMCSTMGFPPWQMRLAEILTLPTHHKLSYQSFLGTIERFAKCKQRFGK